MITHAIVKQSDLATISLFPPMRGTLAPKSDSEALRAFAAVRDANELSDSSISEIEELDDECVEEILYGSGVALG